MGLTWTTGARCWSTVRARSASTYTACDQRNTRHLSAHRSITSQEADEARGTFQCRGHASRWRTPVGQEAVGVVSDHRQHIWLLHVPKSWELQRSQNEVEGQLPDIADGHGRLGAGGEKEELAGPVVLRMYPCILTNLCAVI